VTAVRKGSRVPVALMRQILALGERGRREVEIELALTNTARALIHEWAVLLGVKDSEIRPAILAGVMAMPMPEIRMRAGGVTLDTLPSVTAVADFLAELSSRIGSPEQRLRDGIPSYYS
jgi:hypothetical protein